MIEADAVPPHRTAGPAGRRIVLPGAAPRAGETLIVDFRIPPARLDAVRSTCAAAPSPRFMLARYHDFNYDESGPEALARFLGLGVDAIFPISYDLRRFSNGDAAALAGKILKQPRDVLSENALFAMAVRTS